MDTVDKVLMNKIRYILLIYDACLSDASIMLSVLDVDEEFGVGTQAPHMLVLYCTNRTSSVRTRSELLLTDMS